MTTEIKVEDSVVVKAGTIDPDLNFDIGGWQGRIEDVYNNENTAMIRWDSITLQSMNYDMIYKCENEGLDWERMVLDITEIQKTTPRDKKSDTQKAARILQTKLTDDPRFDEDE